MARQIEWEHLTAADLPEQQVTIWLPPEYSLQPDKHFPVSICGTGRTCSTRSGRTTERRGWCRTCSVRWSQKAVRSRISSSACTHRRVAIVTGFTCRRMLAERIAGPVRAEMDRQASGAFAADRQLAWVTDALKPRIDREFRTQSAASKTTVVGASMGALMACYAAIERPDVFGRAGCVSVPFAPVDNRASRFTEARNRASLGRLSRRQARPASWAPRVDGPWHRRPRWIIRFVAGCGGARLRRRRLA